MKTRGNLVHSDYKNISTTLARFLRAILVFSNNDIFHLWKMKFVFMAFMKMLFIIQVF